ncbi:hypothetical protein AB1Y20_010073 [Prymnesium parvum]|uniref:Peptidase M16C associated domain-containing protein n=1 Tax=Prymnesium parvum TaxID=97485 RepID=A0AB34K3E1_PRYPA|mmetsp:Transcript_43975/g.106820  ORF Transcript_43975/g.106820 Transcript_43975/m.106820 type:complete len:1051 (+) Transcript_43975:47-3199(+)
MAALVVSRLVVGVLGMPRGGPSLGLAGGRALAHSRGAVYKLSMSASTATAPALPAVVAREPATHPAFELLRVEMVDEYTIKCATYRHIKSGAEVVSAQADDDNKVFGIVFPTPVTDSTGVPHILEHSVLCGSDKYTSKEPFVELLKGSLQTFLNAFTYPDRTCYPVASQNTKDFYNLVNVYLDAVLHPRAKRDPTVLAQEGWHYELEDPSAPLTYKGVVFNEMKGVYSSPESRMYRAAQQATFPDNTYSVDSGGDPLVIPSLTFEQFTSFHDAFYHPSNAKIFFYGDDDPAVRLELLDSYLSDFEKPEKPAPTVETQPKKSSPWKVTEAFPASDDAGHMVMVNWLLNDEPFSDVDELALNVLDHLLMGSRTSILYKAMTDANLGESIMGGGLEDELKQATFSIGLKGVKAENVGKVEELALSTLAKAASDGFPEDAIEASLNTIEFRLRECNTGGFPKGLSFMLSMMPRWIYGKSAAESSPLDALRFEQPLLELKRRLAAGEKVFENLLTQLIVENNHRSTVVLEPDATLGDKITAEEEARLAAVKAKLTEEEIAQVIAATAALKAAQLKEDSAADLATIPRVGLADLERKVKEIPIDTQPLAGGGVLLTHALPTAGVVYADVLLDLATLELDEIALVPLLTRLFIEGGTSQLDAVALQRRIGARTGGLSVSTFTTQKVGADGFMSPSDPMSAVHRLSVRAKGTVEKSADMFELVHQVLSDAQFDAKDKVVQLLTETRSRLESAFVSSGNSFASSRLAARKSAVGVVGEMTSGVSYYQTVKQMLALAEEDWPALLASLERVRAKILAKDNVLINLTVDPAAMEQVLVDVHALVDKLPEKAAATPAGPTWLESIELMDGADEAFSITTQVNYVAASCAVFEQGETVRMGAYNVVSRFLSRGYLWDNVRVVGGAYGGGCSLDPMTGSLSFSSYRDPNLQGTLDIYAKCPDVLAALELSDEALEQAIVGAVGDLDKPMTPDSKGFRSMTWYLTGFTTEQRQAYRDQMLATTREDFAAFGERLAKKPLQVAVFGSADAIAKANANKKMRVTKLG